MPSLPQLESQIWNEFQTAARRRHCDPSSLLQTFMRERLEAWEDEQLDEQIRAQARRSGRRAADAVTLVREVRHARRNRRGAS